jgi:carboxymethylenebutenolidase
MSLLAACDSGTDSPVNSGNGADRSAIDSLTNGGGDAGLAENAPVEPAKPIVVENLPYAEVDEQLVYGYFAFLADIVDALPGVIVLHERWGLDDGIRALADRISGQDFVVLAVDLYGGETATSNTGARDLMVGVVEKS